jgi:hypothetical protein
VVRREQGYAFCRSCARRPLIIFGGSLGKTLPRVAGPPPKARERCAAAPCPLPLVVRRARGSRALYAADVVPLASRQRCARKRQEPSAQEGGRGASFSTLTHGGANKLAGAFETWFRSHLGRDAAGKGRNHRHRSAAEERAFRPSPTVGRTSSRAVLRRGSARISAEMPGKGRNHRHRSGAEERAFRPSPPGGEQARGRF